MKKKRKMGWLFEFVQTYCNVVSFEARESFVMLETMVVETRRVVVLRWSIVCGCRQSLGVERERIHHRRRLRRSGVLMKVELGS